MEAKLQVLANIAAEFDKEKIIWAVGASLLLYLKGIVPDFNDLDLMVLDEHALKAKEILEQMGEKKAENPSNQYETRHFYEFIIQGVEVDLMGGFVIVKDGKKIDCSLKESEISEHYALCNQQIPLHSVEIWHTYYKWMQREQKVAILEKWLKSPKKDCLQKCENVE